MNVSDSDVNPDPHLGWGVSHVNIQAHALHLSPPLSICCLHASMMQKQPMMNFDGIFLIKFFRHYSLIQPIPHIGVCVHHS